ncbi:hypothetical protein [Paenibacillus sp. Soil787]|uniref:hypothetical protein n=1 Tax=Paenibacillus sp. Soil787 TaxID=1736411 RepID=UPI000AB860D0|nr:hypothetical protein [Paenibacillus sp. Soil787]
MDLLHLTEVDGIEDYMEFEALFEEDRFEYAEPIRKIRHLGKISIDSAIFLR